MFRADEPALHRIGDLEAWDFLEFQGFGYDDAGDIRARMTDDGDTARFEDQGVIVLLYGTTLAALTDDMFRFS